MSPSSSSSPPPPVPEGGVPPLEQDLSVLLPHLQQHVEQLRHQEAEALQGGEDTEL